MIRRMGPATPAPEQETDVIPLAPNDLGTVLKRGASGQWDDLTLEGPKVFWDEVTQRWAMLYAGSHVDAPIFTEIGLAWSDDLLHWTKDAGNPILSPTGTVDVGSEAGTITAPSIPVYENGLYHLNYLGSPSQAYEPNGGVTHTATAPDLTGPWTRHGPQVEPSGSDWAELSLWGGQVVKRGPRDYHMFMNGSDGTASFEEIGHASAPSLLGPWTLDDAAPVLARGADGTWDELRTIDPVVFKHRGRWWMFYTGVADDGDLTHAMGFASTSEEDFPYGWVKHPSNPVFAPAGLVNLGTDIGGGGRGSLVRTSQGFYIHYTLNNPPTFQIALAVQGPAMMGLWRTVGDDDEPDFENGFVNLGFGFADAQFAKDSLGNVYIRGNIARASGTYPANIFTLPYNYRPAKTEASLVMANYPPGLGRVDTGPNGLVYADTGHNTWIDLSGIVKSLT